jgi:hypothetical protein
VDWMEQLGGLLQQYSGAQGGQASPGVHDDFDRVAQVAPQSAIADGLSAAFRSDQTPPFGQMVSRLFSQSGGQQQAGLLNTLLAAAGPAIVSQVLSRTSGGGASGLAGLLGDGQTQVTPEQAQQIPPEAVEEIAGHAERQDPSVIDQVSNLYARHPTLVKTLGAKALSIALGKVAQGQYGG